MTVTYRELKSTIKGFFLGIGSWMVVLPLRDWIVEHSPLKNTLALGVIIILVVLFLDN